MRFLLITQHLPTDQRRHVVGTYQRLRMFVDAIAGLGELDVLAYTLPGVADSAADARALERRLQRHWNLNLRLFTCPILRRSRELATWPQAKLLARSLAAGAFGFMDRLSLHTSGRRQVAALHRALEREPRAVLAHRLGAMAPLLLSRAALPPVFFDLDDLEHRRAWRNLKLEPDRLRDPLVVLQVPVLFWSELKAAHLARRTFVCSASDRRTLARRTGAAGIEVVPNAVPIPTGRPLPEAPTLLFLGTYEYKPNVWAARELVHEVWPAIRRGRPDARLVLAGPAPDRIRSFTEGVPGIEVPGFVEDLDRLYASTRVVVCPIRAGGGTRIKLIEAAAHGKPIVSTSVGVEGLELRDGREALIRDAPDGFASACLRLLEDRARAERLGAEARRWARQGHGSSSVVRTIRDHLR